MRRHDDAQSRIAMDLIGQIYDAACEPSLWQRFLDSFAGVTRSQAAVIWMHDAQTRAAQLRDGDASFLSTAHVDPAFSRSYEEHYSSVNVLPDKSDRLPEGGLMDSAEFLPQDQLRRTE